MPKDPRTRKTQPVLQPFQGLFLDRPSYTIPPQGFVDCNNVRIVRGSIDSSQSGWSLVASAASLGSNPVRGIYQGSNTNGNTFLVLATTADLFYQGPPGVLGGVKCITPQYTTGTVSASGTAVTGSGTAWTSSIGGNFRANVRQGDQIAFFNSSGRAVSIPANTWFTVQSVNSATSLTLTTSAGTIAAGSSYVVRQCFSTDFLLGNDSTVGIYPWSFESFPGAGSPDNTDLIVATNGNPNDCVVSWDSNTSNWSGGFPPPAKYRSTLPWQARSLRRFKNLLCYGNLYVPPNFTGTYLATSMANSDNGLPFSTNTGVAGQYVVSDGGYQLASMEVLGNTLICYMQGLPLGDVIGASFVGPPLNFTFTEIIRGRGPLSARLVATFPDRHQFVTSDGEYRYNGLFVQPMNTQVWRGVMENFDFTNSGEAYCSVDALLGDVVWVVPLTGAGTQAYVEHYMEQANNYLFKPYTKRDWPFTASAFVGAEASNFLPGPVTLAGDSSGNVWQAFTTGQQGQGGSAPATATSSVTFPPRFVINERSRGLVKRVYPFVDQMAGGSPSLTVTLTMYDRAGGDATITDAQTFDPTSPTTRFTVHYRRGRLGQVGINGAAGWSLGGGDWDVVPGGER